MKHSCFILFLLFVFSVGAQSPPLELIGVEQGLSQGFVTCMIQDEEGFIWAGTPQGLNRYDGHRIKIFTNDVFDSLSLSNNYIYSLLDLGDYLIIGTWGGGINLFHKRTQRFFRLPSKMTEQVGSASKVEQVTNKYPSRWVGQGVLKDKRGNIWSRAHNADNWDEGWAVRMEFPEGFWERLPENPDLLFQIKIHTWWMNQWPELSRTPKYLSLHGDDLYCYQLDHLLSFDYEHNKWRPAQKFINVPDIIVNVVTPKSSEGRLVQSSDCKAYYCNNDGQCKDIGLLPGYVYKVDSALIWTHEGQFFTAYKWPLPNDSLLNLNPITQVPMADGRTTYLFDKSGNLWVADGVTGLSKYILGQQRFDHFFEGHSLMNAPFMAENGSLCYIKWNKENLQFDGLPDKGLAEIKALLTSDNMNGFKINKDVQGFYWMVAHHEHTKVPYIIKINPNKGVSDLIPIPDLKRWALHSMIDDKGILWFAIDGTLVAFDTFSKTREPKWKFYKFSDDHTISPDVNYIEKTADNSIWMATSQGLIRAKPRMDSTIFDFKHYKTDSHNSLSLRSNNVSSLLADPQDANVLWIGTKGGGLHRLDIEKELFRSFTTQEGFQDNVIYGILSDHNINTEAMDYSLWLSTNKGLVQYSPTTEKIKNYRKSEGLQDDEFNTHAFAYTDDLHKKGRLMFGGVNGLNVFDPVEIIENSVKPKVLITNLLINNEPLSIIESSYALTEAIEYTTNVDLPYEKNNLTFDFAALEYTAPSKNKYRYYLKGAEKEWAHEGYEHSASYLNMSPGNYTFLVLGSNNDGVWSDEPATLRIRILPPWYRTFWAYLSYVMIIMTTMWIFYSLKERQRYLKRNLESQQQESEKLQLLVAHERRINEMKLNEFTQRLIEKTELIDHLKARQSELINEKSEWSADLKSKLRDTQILTNEDWDKYLKLFDQVNPGYYDRIKTELPQLSNAEVRWVILYKMNLTQNKMASVLGVTSGAVKKTRQRLLKKLEISEDQTIEDFFRNFY